MSTMDTVLVGDCHHSATLQLIRGVAQTKISGRSQVRPPPFVFPPKVTARGGGRISATLVEDPIKIVFIIYF